MSGGESGSAREAHRRYREGVFSGAPENPEREEDVLAVDASFFGCPSSSVRWTRFRTVPSSIAFFSTSGAIACASQQLLWAAQTTQGAQTIPSTSHHAPQTNGAAAAQGASQTDPGDDGDDDDSDSDDFDEDDERGPPGHGGVNVSRGRGYRRSPFDGTALDAGLLEPWDD